MNDSLMMFHVDFLKVHLTSNPTITDTLIFRPPDKSAYLKVFFSYYSTKLWAVTCDFQQCDILTSVDSDEPVQSPFKLRNSKLSSVSSLTLTKYSSNKQRL